MVDHSDSSSSLTTAATASEDVCFSSRSLKRIRNEVQVLMMSTFCFYSLFTDTFYVLPGYTPLDCRGPESSLHGAVYISPWPASVLEQGVVQVSMLILSTFFCLRKGQGGRET